MLHTLHRSDFNQLVEELRAFDCDRVFLAWGQYEQKPERREEGLRLLREYCTRFKAEGFEVGVWNWTFWFLEDHPFANMRSLSGKEIKQFACPTDEAFCDFAAEYVKDLAQCGVDIIQFDDDFRYGYLADITACLCDNHIKKINALVGENLDRETLAEKILQGGKNKYRSAWLKVNGDALRHFGKRMREAADEINPAIRLSQCTCMSTWDTDGTDGFEIAKILAGKNKPLMRLNGAPYWSVHQSWGNSLADVVELSRMESVWSRQGEIEIVAEGDVYPRPRIQCPANYLEGFDTAIRASGCTDGILKYGMDYVSPADYEIGYRKLHQRNRALYQEIDGIFENKKACGVRVYEAMKKAEEADLTARAKEPLKPEDLFFSKAARSLAACAVPTTYEGDGICGIAFDENCRNLPLDTLKNGMILDIRGAEILQQRGVDVGIDSIGKCQFAEEEIFTADELAVHAYGAPVFELSLAKGAEILSKIKVGDQMIPFSYRYKNKKGQRFLVLNMDTRHEKCDRRKRSDALLRHYARGRQYAQEIQWLSGKSLPAFTCGHPDLYLQTKEKDGVLAIGLWNFFADPAMEPVVELAKEYSSARFVNCQGKLKGDKIILEDISPYGFAFIELT